jgi:DNA invertase Pin-like site-specific DNA recombinase
LRERTCYRIEGNGVRVVLIEDASRFARDLIAQELGIVLLVARGVKVITAAGDDLTDTSDPSRVMMRQISSNRAKPGRLSMGSAPETAGS